jgi:predicted dehydrogenase
MIRLALSGASEALCRDVAPRLRGATLQPGITGEPDAVAFIDAACLDAGEIENLLNASHAVLLAAESCLLAPLLEGLSATAERAGVCFMVVNPDRFLPSRQLIRQQLEAGKLGDVGLVRMHRWEPSTADRVPLSAGPLVRDLDLAVWLVGKPVEIVYAVEAGRFVQVHLGFGGGAMALIDYTDQLPAGDGYTSLSVIGSAGAAYFDDHQNRQLLYSGGSPRAVLTGEGDGYLAGLLQEFIDALRGGAKPHASAGMTTWRHVLAVADAVTQSLTSRQAVRPESH